MLLQSLNNLLKKTRVQKTNDFAYTCLLFKLADTTPILKTLIELSMINWQTHTYIDNDIILNYTFYEIKHIFKYIVFIAISSRLANASQYVLLPPHKIRKLTDVACVPLA